MFGKLFGRNKKTNTSKKAILRDLFEELFLLSKENKNVRVDTGVYEGGEVSMFYDAMIAI